MLVTVPSASATNATPELMGWLSEYAQIAAIKSCPVLPDARVVGTPDIRLGAPRAFDPETQARIERNACPIAELWSLASVSYGDALRKT
jgi:hypothetical protein